MLYGEQSVASLSVVGHGKAIDPVDTLQQQAQDERATLAKQYTEPNRNTTRHYPTSQPPPRAKKQQDQRTQPGRTTSEKLNDCKEIRPFRRGDDQNVTVGFFGVPDSDESAGSSYFDTVGLSGTAVAFTP